MNRNELLDLVNDLEEISMFLYLDGDNTPIVIGDTRIVDRFIHFWFVDTTNDFIYSSVTNKITSTSIIPRNKINTFTLKYRDD